MIRDCQETRTKACNYQPEAAGITQVLVRHVNWACKGQPSMENSSKAAIDVAVMLRAVPHNRSLQNEHAY